MRRLAEGRGPWVLAVYLLAAMVLLYPASSSWGAVVPGAARSDVWNSLWSIWFVADSASRGVLPWTTALLDHPTGGSLLVADPLGALSATPLTLWAGVEVAYAVLMTVRVGLVGWATHLLAAEVLGDEPGGRPWVAGVAMLTAPVLISGLHNGTSEAVALAPVALAAWAGLRACRRGTWSSAVLAGGLLVLSTLASGYAAVVAYVFVGCALLWAPHPWGGVGGGLRRAAALAVGLLGSLPVAWVLSTAATTRGNLVGIKHPAELASVRRSTGPADPWAYVRGFDFRSPDFREISRYGEDFIHSPYLGWTLLGLAAWGLWRRRAERRSVRWLLLAGGITLALSLGPVLVHDGLAWVFLDDRVWPMPYLLLERLPGFGSLSLLWRLGVGPMIALSVVAAWALPARAPRWVALGVLCVGVEARTVAPTADLPAMTEAQVHSALEALSEAPAGAVLNHPVVGGRAYLHEQTTHGQPLAARLNFPNNGVGRVVWEAARRATGQPAAQARKAIRSTAQDMGVRYVVLHDDPATGPDMYDGAVETLRALFPSLPAEGPRAQTGPHAADVVVLRLY